MTTPNKPAALDAVKSAIRREMYGMWPIDGNDVEDCIRIAAEAALSALPLTDLLKAQERIDRLEERVAKLEAGMKKAKSEFLHNTRTPTQCAYMMVAHINAALKRDKQ